MRSANNDERGFTSWEIVIVVAILAFLAAIILPNFIGARTSTAQGACINNLRLIDSAKWQWALEKHKDTNDIPFGSDLRPYLGRGTAAELPYCPQSTDQRFEACYSPNRAGTNPTCKVFPSNPSHTLP
jgi:type II secretory pathway pseudopilin PulG